MAAYTTTIGLNYNIAPATRQRVDFTDAGDVYSTDLGEKIVYDLRINHPHVNATDRDTLHTFYSTNRTSVNTVTLGGIAYNIWFTGPYSVSSENGVIYQMSAQFKAVEQ